MVKSIGFSLVGLGMLLASSAASANFPLNLGVGIVLATRAALQFPTPTGPYSIGTTARHFTDSTRTTQSGDPRELMVHFYYPAQWQLEPKTHGYLHNVMPVFDDLERARAITHWASGLGPYLQYQKTAKAVKVLGQYLLLPALNAAIDAPAITSQNFPVVIFSHGLYSTHGMHMALIEELASQGFIVVAIEHTGSALLVEMPDGRSFPADNKVANSIEMRVEDVAFVIHELKEKPSLPMDFDRIGIAGHSLGGGTALHAAASEDLKDTIKAVAVLDGGFYCGETIKCSGKIRITQPTLGLLSESGHGWRDAYFWRTEGDFEQKPKVINFDDVTHYGFMDISMLRGMPVINWFDKYMATYTGPGGDRAFSDELNAEVADFFATHLQLPDANDNV